MGTFVISGDPDEMPHNVVFHPGLHSLLRTELCIYLKILTFDL